ncbi:PIN domain-containing protein [Pedobacter sp. P26]|uniref:PIN domain-containing protein n=1 Tax=Pedobacter sp. P26 TaxID=3423956 RepID=UPI003D6690A7
MSLDISDLSFHPTPKPGNYFFDTNVWIYVLGVTNGKPFEGTYIDFFNSVYSIAVNSGTSRIITSSLQISELFNRLLKIESNKAHLKQSYGKGEYAYYKDVFRKSAQIVVVFNQFKSDFLAYADAIDVVKCPVSKLEDMLDFSPAVTDFNDNLYISLAKAHEATMVTHDSDLVAQDMKILTLNNTLKKMAKNSVFVKLPKK